MLPSWRSMPVTMGTIINEGQCLSPVHHWRDGSRALVALPDDLVCFPAKPKCSMHFRVFLGVKNLMISLENEWTFKDFEFISNPSRRSTAEVPFWFPLTDIKAHHSRSNGDRAQHSLLQPEDMPLPLRNTHSDKAGPWIHCRKKPQEELAYHEEL